MITKNFKREEFDCKDGTDYPSDWIDTKLKPLCEQLEIIREHFQGKSISITSGYRTPAYNKKVGGAAKSQHVEGIAADFKVSGVDAREVAKEVEKLMDDGKILKGGVGSYSSWCHYDIRRTKATWRK